MGNRVRPSIVEKCRAAYVPVGDFADRWYEELPWRKRIALGIRGEQIAARCLRRRGMLILARNYRAGGAEIDLIADDHGTLVFVEVKARGGDAFGLPQEAVDARKQSRIRRACAMYVASRRLHDTQIRFDVVALTGAGRNRRLEIIKDAF